MPKEVEMTEIYVERLRLVSMGGFTSSDFTEFIRRNNIQSNEDRRYPVFKVISYLNEERKKRQHGRKGASIDELDRQKKHEEVMKIRIANQEKMGILIPRIEAKERVRLAFQAVANKIRYSIKNIAPRLIGMDNERTVEEMLIHSYGNAIKDLENEAKNVSWEEDGLENQPGRTELVNNSGTDASRGDSE